MRTATRDRRLDLSDACLEAISDTWLNADVNTDNIDPKYFCGEYLADRSCVSATRATLDAASGAARGNRQEGDVIAGSAELKTTRCSATASRPA